MNLNRIKFHRRLLGNKAGRFIHVDDFLPVKVRLRKGLDYELEQYLDYLNAELLPNDVSDIFNTKYNWMVSRGLTATKTEFAESELSRLQDCKAGLFIAYLKYLKSFESGIDVTELIIALNFKGGILIGKISKQVKTLRSDFGVIKSYSYLEKLLSKLRGDTDIPTYILRQQAPTRIDWEKYHQIKEIFDSGGIDQYINELSRN